MIRGLLQKPNSVYDLIGIRDEKYLKKFGKNLKKLRECKNMSQEELAFTADVSLPQITRIERGVVNTTICTVNALAKALKVPTAEMFEF